MFAPVVRMYMNVHVEEGMRFGLFCGPPLVKASEDSRALSRLARNGKFAARGFHPGYTVWPGTMPNSPGAWLLNAPVLLILRIVARQKVNSIEIRP